LKKKLFSLKFDWLIINIYEAGNINDGK
jgi:hypothetical protein